MAPTLGLNLAAAAPACYLAKSVAHSSRLRWLQASENPMEGIFLRILREADGSALMDNGIFVRCTEGGRPFVRMSGKIQRTGGKDDY